MKARPIIMSAHSVLAILAGTKTATRRVLTLPRGVPTDTLAELVGWRLERLSGAFGKSCTGEWEGVLPSTPDGFDPTAKFPDGPATYRVRCPYGALGDRLWVREAHAMVADGCIWRAAWDEAGLPPGAARWRPGIYMPRWASRLTLEIVSVCVERLHAITEEGAIAEGMVAHRPGLCNYIGCHSARTAFAKGWDTINGKRAPWASNPWVWVLDFKRADGGPDGR